MLVRSIGAALLTLGTAHGLSNTSPLFIRSTQPLETENESLQLASANTINNAITKSTSECAAAKYFIISQPGLTAADLHDSKELAQLRIRSIDSGYAGKMDVAGVLGDVDAVKMAEDVAKACGAPHVDGEKANGNSWDSYRTGEKEVKLVQYAALPSERQGRKEALKMLDERLSAALPKPKDDHVIIFVSSPVEKLEHHDQFYEMDEPYPTAMHQDLKRDVWVQERASGNNTMQDGLPLFEKYQFLTPGLFMGLTVSLLLLVILWVGVSAIAGLEVSYMAFSKEMGPQAQNKGKQQ